MRGKIFATILIFVLIISAMPLVAQAVYSPPTSFGAPEDFSVHIREDGFEKTPAGFYVWTGFEANVSAPDDLRSFVDVAGTDDSPFKADGYYFSGVLLQFDYKVDDGNWHYQNQWDEDTDYNSNKSIIRIEKGQYSNYTLFDKSQFEAISSGETLPADKTYFDSHTMHFRVRFLVSYQDINGLYSEYYSLWSKTTSFSNNQIIEDPSKLINHVPVLKSAKLNEGSDRMPYFDIIVDKPHEDLRHLSSLSNNYVGVEIWVKAGSGEWALCTTDNFVEEFIGVNASTYFGALDNYEEALYDIKFRYSFDYYHYPEAGKSGVIYSPFSNVISHGMPAYSNASNWAKEELDKATEYGLIPDSLKGADMTKPITREEFAELVVKLYEKTTLIAAVAASPNPFTDTKNPEILKAYQLGITTGTSKTTFAPKELTNREQVATMLSRAIRKWYLLEIFLQVGLRLSQTRKIFLPGR